MGSANHCYYRLNSAKKNLSPGIAAFIFFFHFGICHPDNMIATPVKLIPDIVRQIRFNRSEITSEADDVRWKLLAEVASDLASENLGSPFDSSPDKFSFSIFSGRTLQKLPIFRSQVAVVQISKGGRNNAAKNSSAQKTEPKGNDIRAWHIVVGIFLAMFGGFCGFLMVQSIINFSRWISEKPYSNGGNTNRRVLRSFEYGFYVTVRGRVVPDVELSRRIANKSDLMALTTRK
jgi:hypothetical protein